VLTKAEEVPGGGRAGYELRLGLDGVSFMVWRGTPVPIEAFVAGVVGRGRWHHLVGRKTSSEVAIFIDGVPADRTRLPITGSTSNTAALMFGPGLSGGEFNGAIDDVRLYARALTDQEIDALARTPAP
jgi:hypothetical protein